MKEYRMDTGLYSGVFAVPNVIIDEYLKLASKNSMAVLLVVLRHSGEALTENEIGNLTGLSHGEIYDALKFWISLEVIEEGISSMNIVSNLVMETEDETQKSTPKAKETVPKLKKRTTLEKVIESQVKREGNLGRNVSVISSVSQRIPQEEAVKRIEESEDLKFLVARTGEILGKDLHGDVLSSLVKLHEEEEMPIGSLLMLIDFCKRQNRTSWRDIESQIIHCKNQNIVDHEEIDEYIKYKTNDKGRHGIVRRAFGLGRRKLIASEEEHIAKWFDEYKMNEEMLVIAYERCIEYTGDLSYPYIDTILESWSLKGIRTSEAAEKEEKPSETTAKKRKTKQTKNMKKGINTNTSYDIDEVEKFFLYKTPKI